MAGHYLRKRLRSPAFARRLACFSGILLVVAVITFRWQGVGYRELAILLSLVGLCAMLALAIAVVAIARVWRHGHEGGGPAVAALLIGALVAAPFALLLYLDAVNPPANRAETDGMAQADPGPDRSGPNEDAAISGRVFSARASQIYQAVRLVLGDKDWDVRDVEAADPVEPDDAGSLAGDDPPPAIGRNVPVPTPRVARSGETEDAGEPDPLDQPEAGEYRIAAVAKGPILGLPSDVEIRIVEDEAQGYLDLRSVSRYGARDFGQNRRLIEDFLTRVDAAMIGVAATGTN